MEEAGVKLIAEGASAYMSDLKSATGATDTFVDTTEKGGGIVSKAGGMMGSAIKTVAGIAAGLGVAGFVALGKSIYDGIGAARESAKLNASTAQTIETMGNAAGRSVDQITDLASALSDASGKSLFGDDQIQQSENLLLTFGNIKGETFDLATALTVDLAQALGGAPADQAMMLGKALQDPVKGITALGKAGLTFSSEQKAMIASMVEAGDIAGAQGLIIAELNKQVGGQAAAAAEAEGGWTQFTATLGELEESVGAMLLPLLNELVGFLNENVIPVVTDMVDVFGSFMESGDLDLLAEDIQKVFGIDITAFVDSVTDTIDVVMEMVKWFNEGGAASVDLGTQIDDLNGIWEKVLRIIGEVAGGYQAIIEAVLPQIQQFIADHGEEIQAFFKQTWDTIIQIINLALDIYQAVVPPVLHAIADFINDHGSEIQKIFTGVWQAISAIISGALETIKTVLKLALDLIHGDWDAAWQDIKHIGEVQWEAIKGGITGFLNAIAGIFDTTFSDIVQTWRNNWDMLVEIAGKVVDRMVEIGANIVQGIIDGVQGAAGSLFSTLQNLASDALQAAKDALGVGSPSKEFATIGKFMVQGMMEGFAETWPEMTNLVGNLSKDLIDEMENIGQDMQNAIAGGFGATASMDRQMSKNLDEIGKIQDAFTRKIVGQDLDALQKKANSLFADPKVAADYYKMVSGHEFETLKIRQQIAKATTADEKARLEQQLVLISRAQDAEVDQFQAKQKGVKTPSEQIADQINEVMRALSDPKLKLTDDQLKIVDLLTGVYQQFARPPSTAMMPGSPGQGGYSSTTNVNMPIYTNNSPAALQQSWAIMQASMT